ncbi:MAG: D-aminoacyl-tRNA deacylase [Rhodospirillales bacterium]|nr:D-aminoacyl-tRNA deacylase [Rhodospirillales bacterium]MCY4003276.1 D-aminoacyl-tRNA deacylase [Rhodospirillales bacterium]
MIGLLQRVSSARVDIGPDTVGAIGTGLMVLIGVERGDTERTGDRLVERLVGYRVFPDDHGKMNLSVADIGAGLLLVPQFTLPADTRKGARPSLSGAAPPDEGQRLFEHVVRRARALHPLVETGRFGAHMKVSLTNDGPVTFTLRVAPPT